MDNKVQEQKIRRLEFQNKRLSEKVEVQKSDIAERQKTIDELSKRWSDAQVAVLAVRRGWTQLHDDLKEIAFKANIVVADTQSLDNTFIDPILATLLKSSDQESATEAQEHAQVAENLAEETDRELKREATKSLQLLSQILANLPTVGTTTDTDSIPKSDQQAAAYRAAKERAKIAEDRLQRQETELSDLRSQLLNTRVQLETAQRKILSYKNTSQQETPQSKSQPVTPSSKSSKDPAEKKEETLESRKELVGILVDSMVEKLTEELEKERSEHSKTEKQLRDAEAKFTDGEWIAQTRLYKTVLEQKHQSMGEIEKLKREIERMEYLLQTKDADLAKKETTTNDPQLKIDAFVARKEAQKRLAELQKQVMKSDRFVASEPTAKDTLPQSTLDEFQQLVKQSQDETTRVKKRLKESTDHEKLMQEARNESVDAGKRLKKAQSEVEELKHKLKDVVEKREEMLIREMKLREHGEDLKVFIDVLATCDLSSRQWNEADAKKREKSILRENETLKKRLAQIDEPLPRDKQDLQQELASSKKQLQTVTSQLHDLKGKLEELGRKNKHVTEDLSQQKQLNAALEHELEQTGQAYEDTQSQSTKLLEKMAQKDANMIQCRRQLTKMTNRVEELTSLVKNLEEKEKSNKNDEKELDDIRSAFETKIADLLKEIATLKDEVESIREKLSVARIEVDRHRMEKKDVEEQLECFQKTAQDRKRVMDAEIDKHIADRSKRQKLESDAKQFEALKQKMREGTLTKADVSNEHDIEILNKEVESLRRCLNCSICGMESKSVILLKCMHTFCKSCIDNRIETRSRRCPGCGTAFSREEVRPFYLS